MLIHASSIPFFFSLKLVFLFCVTLQLLYLDSVESGTPTSDCVLRVEAWNSKLIAEVMQKDKKEDEEFGKLRVKETFFVWIAFFYPVQTSICFLSYLFHLFPRFFSATA